MTYQEQLWAESDTKNSSKKSNKSKKQKKKDKKKKSSKKTETEQEDKSGTGLSVNENSCANTEEDGESVTKSSSISDDGSAVHQIQTVPDSPGSKRVTRPRISDNKKVESKSNEIMPAPSDNEQNLTVLPAYNDLDADAQEILRKRSSSPVDFVLYLQQTGSILALAKLMDALDAADELDDQANFTPEMDEIDVELMNLNRHTQIKSIAH